MREKKSYTLLDWIAIQEVTSSTDATPIQITFAAHWYATWDQVTIVGHLTNTNANWTWTVTKDWANTFTLDGSIATWGWAWGNTWILCKAAKVIDIQDFRHAVIALSYWTSTATVKFAGSLWKSTSSDWPPDFAKAQSATNHYDYIEVVDLEDGAYIDWDTWVAVAGTTDYRLFELNVNALKWFTVVPVAPTDGSSAWTLTVMCTLYDNL